MHTRRPFFFYYYSGFALLCICTTQHPRFFIRSSLRMFVCVTIPFRSSKKLSSIRNNVCVCVRLLFILLVRNKKKGLHCHKHRCQQSIRPFFLPPLNTAPHIQYDDIHPHTVNPIWKKKLAITDQLQRSITTTTQNISFVRFKYKFEMKKKPD